MHTHSVGTRWRSLSCRIQFPLFEYFDEPGGQKVHSNLGFEVAGGVVLVLTGRLTRPCFLRSLRGCREPIGESKPAGLCRVDGGFAVNDGVSTGRGCEVHVVSAGLCRVDGGLAVEDGVSTRRGCDVDVVSVSLSVPKLVFCVALALCRPAGMTGVLGHGGW